MRYWIPLPMLALAAISAFFVAWIVKDMVELDVRHKAFVEECMSDGHKRYECEALWGQARGGGHSVPLIPK